MNRHGTIDRVAKPLDHSPDTYRLLATGRIELSPSPNGREPSVNAARPADAPKANHGSVYLPRWRFRSRRRQRHLVSSPLEGTGYRT
jgi:hypothetical protein